MNRAWYPGKYNKPTSIVPLKDHLSVIAALLVASTISTANKVSFYN